MTLLDDNSFPPRNLETDEEICLYISEHQGIKAHNQGYEWFWTVYMPALERVAESRSLDAEVIANNFYAVGDVHDFNESPRTAITYYKIALDFDPEMSAAHREIANMYHRLGFIDAAIHHSDQALALWPDEKSAISDREHIDADKKDIDPYYEKADRPAALAADALAKQSPKEAIKLLKRFEDVENLRALTWAYGADNNIPAYLTTWKILILQSHEIWFSYRDWFFMPEEIWYEAEIWAIWKDSNLSFTGVFVTYEGLDDTQCDAPIDDNFSKLTDSDGITQKIEYIFYCQSENLNGLKTIQLKYPNWVELNEKIEMLENPNP